MILIKSLGFRVPRRKDRMGATTTNKATFITNLDIYSPTTMKEIRGVQPGKGG